MNHDLQQAHQSTLDAWNSNATHWDNQMGDAGNIFVNQLIWPSAQRLLALQAGERVLDAGCGNGLYSRRLAALGAEVVGFDFAESMIERARQYSNPTGKTIEYHVLDGTDEAALLTLGEARFDAALSTMVLMDMAVIDPLFRALAKLLRPGGRFVFSVCHPCFNQINALPMAEMEDHNGKFVTRYAMKVRGYLTSSVGLGTAIADQPKPQHYFDRPLQELLGAGFAAGFVVDALEERALPSDSPIERNPLAWNGNFSEIPPVMVVRMRRMA
ncbi:MAG: class I SAM-dependent methyltransferase [Caldilineaceae bacterium]